MKTLSEYINESLLAGAVYAGAGLIGVIIGSIISDFSIRYTYGESLKDMVKTILADKKAEKIVKKLAKDQEVKEFFKLTPYQQRGKWIELLKSKLPEDEYKYIKKIAKSEVGYEIHHNNK